MCACRAHVCTLMTRKPCAGGMRNAIPRNRLNFLSHFVHTSLEENKSLLSDKPNAFTIIVGLQMSIMLLSNQMDMWITSHRLWNWSSNTILNKQFYTRLTVEKYRAVTWVPTKVSCSVLRYEALIHITVLNCNQQLETIFNALAMFIMLQRTMQFARYKATDNLHSHVKL